MQTCLHGRAPIVASRRLQKTQYLLPVRTCKLQISAERKYTCAGQGASGLITRKHVNQCQQRYYRHIQVQSSSSSASDPRIVLPDEPPIQDKAPQKSAWGLLLVLGGLAAAAAAVWASGSWPSIKAYASNSALGQSGFLAAFSLIFLSELGDKTFFIAGLLAMKVGRWCSFIGSTAALSIMTVISVCIGCAFKSLPEVMKSSLPIGQYLGAAFMLVFGIRTLKEAWEAPEATDGEGEDGELQLAHLSISSAVKEGKVTQQATWWQALFQVGSLIFLAEWGDRSMLATIALGASQSPIGVATGASLAHAAATAIAVIGGAFMSQYISEKTVGYIGGSLFLVFAALTVAGFY